MEERRVKFQVITLFPEMIENALAAGVVHQGLKKGLLRVTTLQPREGTTDAHRSVDDRPFGGGDGMVFMPDILEKAVDRAKATGPTRVIYLSPQGPRLTDEKLKSLAQESSLTLICGRYGGLDQRALYELVDEELSIGDYVISGGELAALVVIDGVARQLPGVLGHAESASADSFADGLLEAPQFTRPREWRGHGIPEVLLSGDHARIGAWRATLARLITLKKRPDLLPDLDLKTKAELQKLWSGLSPEDREICGLKELF